jgi:phosphatidylcholine synthase
MSTSRSSSVHLWRAAAVHVYTASGSVLALLIVLAAIEGDVRAALWLGLAALVVDGTDGTLARRFGVKERLPWFDGARLDDIVDYLTYAFAPVVLCCRAATCRTGGRDPRGRPAAPRLQLPVLPHGRKTDDHFFLGFPSYWNVVAFYAVAMDLSPGVVSTVVVVCAVLVAVPVGYLYPSRMTELRTLTLSLSLAWMVAYALIVAQLPDPHPLLIGASLLYIAYYVALSLHLDAKRRRTARRRAPLRPVEPVAV